MNSKPLFFLRSSFLILFFSLIFFSCSNSNEDAIKDSTKITTSDSLTEDQKRLPENALKGLVVANGLEIHSMATEPMLKNPTNIDVDDRGRIWVTEAYNYRPDINGNPTNALGDRIMILEDVNGDGRVDGNDQKADPKINQSRPSTYGALNGYISWKGIDLTFMVQGSTGRKDFWLNAFNNVNFGTSRYASTWDHWYNPWSVENRDGAWPRLGGSGNNTIASSFWLDDMSYLRVKNLQIGYSLPQSLLRRAHIASLRIAGSAENLATITSYRGLDPEKAGDANNMYPIVKSYSLVIQLGF